VACKAKLAELEQEREWLLEEEKRVERQRCMKWEVAAAHEHEVVAE
jgi:hypothetical protein